LLCKFFASPHAPADLLFHLRQKSAAAAEEFLAAAIAPEIVQTGFSLRLMRVFSLVAIHFHTVFNKTVENFNRPFTFPSAFMLCMVRELHAQIFLRIF